MRNGHIPSKEEKVPMIEQIDHLNEEADQIKEAVQARRSATHKNLAVLSEMLEQFSEETQAAAANMN